MTTTLSDAPEKAKAFFTGRQNFTIGPLQVREEVENSGEMIIIDVRAAQDFIKKHVPRAINLPEGNWDGIKICRKERPLVVYGYSHTCRLAAHAALEFTRQGHCVREMEGGFETWRKNKLPVEI